MADIEIVSMSHLANIPDALRDAIVARARENSKAKDGVGADIQPRASQESLLNEARREVEGELRAAAQPRAATDVQLAFWKLEKAAFSKKLTPAQRIDGQSALVRAIGEAEGHKSAADWNTKLGSTVPGKNPHKAEIKASKAAGKTEVKTFGDIPDTGFNRTFHPEALGIKEKPSKNPYKNDPSPQRDKEIAGIISRKGTVFAAGLAKAAGVSISGRPLNVKG